MLQLNSKSILAPKEEDDGLRISIMSRHTLNDGITPDARITTDLYNLHVPEFAPPPKFVGAYLRGEMPFEEYHERYLEYLIEECSEKIDALLRHNEHWAITVLCIEESPEFCHRKTFVEFAEKIAWNCRIAVETLIQ